MTLGFVLAAISYWKVFGWMTGDYKDNPFLLGVLVFYMVILVTMWCYGPIAAFLVELFPARIRYTSMSLPYHVGNGVFLAASCRWPAASSRGGNRQAALAGCSIRSGSPRSA